MAKIAADSVWEPRLNTALLTAFAVVTLALALTGIYGLIVTAAFLTMAHPAYAPRRWTPWRRYGMSDILIPALTQRWRISCVAYEWSHRVFQN